MTETPDTESGPFADGKGAAERRAPAHANPHPAGSEAHARWAEGHASVIAPDEIADDLADFA